MPAKVLQTGGTILTRANAEYDAVETDGNTTFLYFALNSHMFKHWSLVVRGLTGTTVTMEFSNSKLADGDIDAATAATLAALNWEDQTEERTGNPSIADDFEYTQDMNEPWYIGRLRLVTTAEANGITVDFNAMY